jgi:hypothetical protein
MLCKFCIFRVVSIIVILFSLLLLPFGSEYRVSAKSDEVAIRGSKALLSEGEAVKATIKAEKPTAMNEVSFSARTIGLSDPFATSRIPFTVEVYEGNQLVASESFTESLSDKLQNVDVPINNIPKMDEKYKLLIRYDTPENGGQNNNPIQIDTESIKVNEGDDGLDVHGRIKIVF